MIQKPKTRNDSGIVLLRCPLVNINSHDFCPIVKVDLEGGIINRLDHRLDHSFGVKLVKDQVDFVKVSHDFLLVNRILPHEKSLSSTRCRIDEMSGNRLPINIGQSRLKNIDKHWIGFQGINGHTLKTIFQPIREPIHSLVHGRILPANGVGDIPPMGIDMLLVIQPERDEPRCLVLESVVFHSHFSL